MSSDGTYEINYQGKVCTVNIEDSASGTPRVSMQGDFDACAKAQELIDKKQSLPPSAKK